MRRTVPAEIEASRCAVTREAAAGKAVEIERPGFAHSVHAQRAAAGACRAAGDIQIAGEIAAGKADRRCRAYPVIEAERRPANRKRSR